MERESLRAKEAMGRKEHWWDRSGVASITWWWGMSTCTWNYKAVPTCWSSTNCRPQGSICIKFNASY